MSATATNTSAQIGPNCMRVPMSNLWIPMSMAVCPDEIMMSPKPKKEKWRWVKKGWNNNKSKEKKVEKLKSKEQVKDLVKVFAYFSFVELLRVDEYLVDEKWTCLRSVDVFCRRISPPNWRLSFTIFRSILGQPFTMISVPMSLRHILVDKNTLCRCY